MYKYIVINITQRSIRIIKSDQKINKSAFRRELL
jgi:hypothetical protein